MKYSWMIYVLLLMGCDADYTKKQHEAKEAVTVSSTYYLSTIVHDEHLFIYSNYFGYFTHHFNCPCLKNQPKSEPNNAPPIIIDFSNSKSISPIK